MKQVCTVLVMGLLLSAPLDAPLADAGQSGTEATPSSHTSPTAKELLVRQEAIIAKTEHDQDETHTRNLKLLTRLEAAAQRQERDQSRFEKILETWERQQAQYQKYLDSLPK